MKTYEDFQDFTLTEIFLFDHTKTKGIERCTNKLFELFTQIQKEFEDRNANALCEFAWEIKNLSKSKKPLEAILARAEEILKTYDKV